MEILRTAPNPWGQQVLVGVAWDLLWVALFAGILFVVGHALYVSIMAPKAPRTAAESAPDVPERVERHSAASRTFHWLNAISMFTLLITAFFPVIGVQFAWVTIHWIAGIALTLLIIYHIVHATTKQDFWSVWIGKKEMRQALEAVGKFLRRQPAKEERSGKYPLDQRAYHNAVTVVAVGVIVTGLIMMVGVDTWFWASNPYFLSDSTWGLVFVLHGLCGVALVTMVIAHVYFAIRPEKRWMTRSMIKGWITREEYLEHYDPAMWTLGSGSAGAEAGADAASADSDAVAHA
ncbi:cytochrome b/b6 domain-containing protein [Candidatus Palauibacter sp.]|uniref:cytochrome b/b6 domain-containing protein n=1 Tax=Candidatus Palauibacter sp. TaxID=3101350 RepID=UPI003AF22798